MILCEGLPIIGFFFFISMPVLLVKYLIQDFRKRYRHQKLEREQRDRFEELERMNRETEEALRYSDFIREEVKKRSEETRKLLDEINRTLEQQCN